MKVCPECKEEKPLSEFYNRRGKQGGSSYCKKCNIKTTIERFRESKDKVVAYLGGKCIKCGYNKSVVALDVHHLDPSKKFLEYKGIKGRKFENIKKELDGCVLLCANCHREEHHMAP